MPANVSSFLTNPAVQSAFDAYKSQPGNVQDLNTFVNWWEDPANQSGNDPKNYSTDNALLHSLASAGSTDAQDILSHYGEAPPSSFSNAENTFGNAVSSFFGSLSGSSAPASTPAPAPALSILSSTPGGAPAGPMPPDNNAPATTSAPSPAPTQPANPSNAGSVPSDLVSQIIDGVKAIAQPIIAPQANTTNNVQYNVNSDSSSIIKQFTDSVRNIISSTVPKAQDNTALLYAALSRPQPGQTEIVGNTSPTSSTGGTVATVTGSFPNSPFNAFPSYLYLVGFVVVGFVLLFAFRRSR